MSATQISPPANIIPLVAQNPVDVLVTDMELTFITEMEPSNSSLA